VADTKTETIDFTVMYATHRAFRRDLRRLAAAVADGRAAAPEVRAGWDNFNHQLHNHHSVEDAALWPQVAEKVTSRPDDQRLLEEMEAEHAELGPRLDAVDAALKAASPDLAAHVDELSTVMDHHFKHEEDSALPLIQDVLVPAEWKKFGLANASALGVKGVAVYIPWVLDGASPEEQREFLGAFPPPVKVANKLLWQRQYAKKGLFTS
jgi:iron-sulfur cluster repair protein YtfE (RIC family)